MKIEFELKSGLYNRFKELLKIEDFDNVLNQKVQEYIIDNVKIDMESVYTCKYIEGEYFKIENTVKENDKLFIILNDGSKIDFFIFDEMYDKSIDPVKFFKSGVNITDNDIKEGKNIITNADPTMSKSDIIKHAGFDKYFDKSSDNQSDTSLGKITPNMIVLEKDKS